jgi:hypothetical protein
VTPLALWHGDSDAAKFPRHAGIGLTVDTYGGWLPMGHKAAVDRLDGGARKSLHHLPAGLDPLLWNRSKTRHEGVEHSHFQTAAAHAIAIQEHDDRDFLIWKPREVRHESRNLAAVTLGRESFVGTHPKSEAVFGALSIGEDDWRPHGSFGFCAQELIPMERFVPSSGL